MLDKDTSKIQARLARLETLFTSAKKLEKRVVRIERELHNALLDLRRIQNAITRLSKN